MDKQIAAWKGRIAHYETDKKDGTEALMERAKATAEGRELSNHRLEHYEYASGLLQIAIVLASAAIITGIATLMWVSVGLGAIGAVLMAFGYFAPTRSEVPAAERVSASSAARAPASQWPPPAPAPRSCGRRMIGASATSSEKNHGQRQKHVAERHHLGLSPHHQHHLLGRRQRGVGAARRRRPRSAAPASHRRRAPP